MIEEDYLFTCPHCGEEISLRLDPTAGKIQEFSYDCEICCRPISIRLKFSNQEIEEFDAQPES